MKVLLYVDNKGYTKKMTDQTPWITWRRCTLRDRRSTSGWKKGMDFGKNAKRVHY